MPEDIRAAGDPAALSRAASATSLARWLDAFQSMRARGVALLRGVSKRIATDMNCDVRESGAALAAAAAGSPGVRRALSERIRSAWSLVRLMHRQQREIARVCKEQGAEVTLLPLSTKRLTLVGVRSARLALRGYVRALPGASDPDLVGDALRDSGHILLFDPRALSPLWADITSCWAERIHVVDDAFVGFTLARSPIRSLARICALLAGLFAARSAGQRHGFQAMFAAAAFAAAYEQLLSRFQKSRAWFLTSNSFSTEVLRAILLRESSCLRMCEILHGVPSLEFQEYLQAMARGAVPPGKLTFVPQIAGLPASGILAESMARDPAFAVNLSLNHYFVRNPPAQVLSRLASEAGQLAGRDSETAGRIICLMGATSHDPDYATSLAFRIERAILRHVRETLAACGRPALRICYAPHPAHAPGMFERVPEFEQLDVLVCRDTVPMWLTADLCIALYSSALFEAAFAGARVYTPLRVTDEIYPREFLDILAHPQEIEEPLQPLTRELHRLTLQGSCSLLTKAQGRLGRLT